jgi:hypothetical protein
LPWRAVFRGHSHFLGEQFKTKTGKHILFILGLMVVTL